MQPHTMEGEDRPRGVTSRRARRRSRKARGGSAGAVLFVLLALGGGWLYLRGREGGQPAGGAAAPASAPVAARALTDGERAALIAAGRALRGGYKVRESMTPEQAVDFDRVVAGLESGRFGFEFRSPAVTLDMLQLKQDGHGPIWVRLVTVADALEKGDLRAAFSPELAALWIDWAKETGR